MASREWAERTIQDRHPVTDPGYVDAHFNGGGFFFMNHLGAFTRGSAARRVFFMVLPVLALALVGGSSGHAASADAPPAATRDHGHGHWFRHVCAEPSAKFAWCGAQVVTSSNGVPLASSTPPASALTPAAFHTAYALPTTSASGTPTIAIVDAYDDPNIEADLAVFDSQFGLPPCTTANGCFRKVDQNGGTSYPSGTSWHLEIALDVEVAHAICQNCKILLVEASSASIAALGTAVNTAVALGANVVSNSYGAGEFSSETSYDAYYKHPGVAVTASSGDGGYGVEYPAASQYVTAVGGTTLSLNTDKTYKSESVWNGAGSGCSAFEPKPTWQTDTGCTKRTVADVSADADPNSGAAIYDSIGVASGQGWYQVGGTSLASPLVGAVYALTGSSSFNYGSDPYGQTAFLNDVTTGNNGTCSPTYLCTAGAGYDGPSGLGTPHGLGAFGGSSAPSPDFSLSVSPTSRTVTAGTAATYSVTVAPSNGFSGTVGFDTAGLPSGATPAWSGSTLTVTTSSTLAAGSYPFTITGTSGSLSHSTSATLVVQAAPDFSVGISPATQTVTAGNPATYTVSVTPSNGFSGSVTFAANGLPSGATPSFGGSTLTVTTTTAVAGGSYPFTVVGTSGTLSHSASATLVVQAAPPADFALSVPASSTVTAGGQTTFAVTITPSNGFSSSVSLSQTGLPAGATPGFSPNPATTASTLTVTTSASLAPGSYPFTITGTSGTLSHTASATLVVKAPATPDFALGVTPSSTTVTVGATATFTVSVTPSNGFSGSVTFGTSGLPVAATPGFSGSTLTVGTASVTPGSYPFTITGTSGSLVHSVAATLVVQAPPDFSLGISPGSQTVTPGGQAAYTVTVTPSNGFNGSVSFGTSGLPAGAAPTFSGSTLTVGTSGVTPGTYPFTVTGTSGSLVHTATATLVVQAVPAGPTLSVSPTSARHGTNVTVTWSGVASPSSTDWIGIFRAGSSNMSYLSYEYDSTCHAGQISSPRSSGSCSFKLPTQNGSYEFRLMANNGFTPIVTGVLVTVTN
jgi:hypothetical protein